jgi:hypothetical protein
MLVLLQEAWPWIVGGIVCCWGIATMKLTPGQWLELLMSLPFTIFFSEPTSDEKQHQPAAADIVDQQPGCAILTIGCLLLVFGIFRLVW